MVELIQLVNVFAFSCAPWFQRTFYSAFLNDSSAFSTDTFQLISRLVLSMHIRLYLCLSVQAGVRAVILSPTRELCQQTERVVREFARFTDITCCLLIGGESMDAQVMVAPA